MEIKQNSPQRSKDIYTNFSDCQIKRKSPFHQHRCTFWLTEATNSKKERKLPIICSSREKSDQSTSNKAIRCCQCQIQDESRQQIHSIRSWHNPLHSNPPRDTKRQKEERTHRNNNVPYLTPPPLLGATTAAIKTPLAHRVPLINNKALRLPLRDITAENNYLRESSLRNNCGASHSRGCAPSTLLCLPDQ